MIIFKIAPDYTIAHDYKNNDCICLDEWTGKTVEDFTAAMSRPADHIKKTELPSKRTITEHIWN